MAQDFPGGSDGKVSAYNAGNSVSIPGSGRSPMLAEDIRHPERQPIVFERR